MISLNSIQTIELTEANLDKKEVLGTIHEPFIMQI